MDGYLSKPIRSQELDVILEKYLVLRHQAYASPITQPKSERSLRRLVVICSYVGARPDLNRTREAEP